MKEKTDLTVSIDDNILNIRVAVLAKTKNGYLLEKYQDEYYFFVGGRVKIDETSEEAAKREFYEETGVRIEKIEFKTVIENFFIAKKKFHELCFVYTTNEEIEIKNLPSNIIECQSSDFITKNIKPEILRDYILSNDNRPHIISKEY